MLFENIGAGALAPAVVLEGGLGRSTTVATSDVDGDGLSDLVLARNQGLGGVNLQVHRRTGPGLTFEAARDWLSGGVLGVFDVDQDGDEDIVGSYVVRSRRFEGPGAGSARQYGMGSPGTDGVVPLIVLAGPAIENASAQVRIRRALGGSIAVVLVSSGEAAAPDVPATGLTTWVDLTQLLTFFATPLSGAAGVAGDGGVDLPFTVGPALVGLTLYHQAWCLDPEAPSQIAVTQGLEAKYGFAN